MQIYYIIRYERIKKIFSRGGGGVKHRFAMAKPVPMWAKRSFTIAKKHTSPPPPLDPSMVHKYSLTISEQLSHTDLFKKAHVKPLRIFC